MAWEGTGDPTQLEVTAAVRGLSGKPWACVGVLHSFGEPSAAPIGLGGGRINPSGAPDGSRLGCAAWAGSGCLPLACSHGDSAGASPPGTILLAGHGCGAVPGGVGARAGVGRRDLSCTEACGRGRRAGKGSGRGHPLRAHGHVQPMPAAVLSPHPSGSSPGPGRGRTMATSQLQDTCCGQARAAERQFGAVTPSQPVLAVGFATGPGAHPRGNNTPRWWKPSVRFPAVGQMGKDTCFV